jgi:hypothetical protein
MSELPNQEFRIPSWQATASEASVSAPTSAGASLTVQKTVITGKTVINPELMPREVMQSENEMILEILKIGNEVEALRVRKIGEKYVEFRKTTTRTTH